MAIKRIAVLTGGGDCPGLNPAIKWVVKTAGGHQATTQMGREPIEVYGIRNGWEGMLKAAPETIIKDPGRDFGEESYMRLLDENEVRPWDRLGGTRLGSSRTNPYSEKNNRSKQLLENFERLKIDALVAIGGDDTQGVAMKLSREGVKVIGIPKTIDKDLPGTDYSLGFDTAVQVITDEIDRLRTTAGSHGRTFVVETMGRNAGHLALQGGVAGGAYVILIPEHKFNIQKVADMLIAERKHGVRYSIVVAAEAVRDDGGELAAIVEDEAKRKAHEADEEFGHLPLGGVVNRWLSYKIGQMTGFETRGLELSHLQRGGSPSNFDRRMGRLFGIAAVDLLLAGHTGRMVAKQAHEVTHVSLEEKMSPVADMSEADRKAEKHVKLLNTVRIPEEYDVACYNAPRQVFAQ
jgi:ATP-dependent phosphofructokinase / diphosphate-dependent phosphofructokinase